MEKNYLKLLFLKIQLIIINYIIKNILKIIININIYLWLYFFIANIINSIKYWLKKYNTINKRII